jgi:predicted DNA-binding transcriptional regulator AlpA
MKTYEFSVVASGLDPDDDAFEARFYDGGCDDATVSFQKGHVIVDFAREAETPQDAVDSAVADVERLGALVDRVEPDPLVTLAEIAARTGVSRASITQYVKGQRGPGGFPAPVARVTSGNPLWRWATVTGWLLARGKVGQEVVAEAEAIERANRNVLQKQDGRSRVAAS